MSDPFIPSPELAAITGRWIGRMMRGDGDGAANLFSPSDALHYCGTAPNEVWSGAALRDLFPEHVGEIPPSYAENVSVRGFESGDTGWSFWEGDITWPAAETTAHMRITLVFAMEAAIWRIVHAHLSLPVPNREGVGYDHTAVDALLKAAEDSDARPARSGTATIMFTDIANSTALAQAVGDATWARIVQRHVDSVAACIAAEDGRLIKSLGDGTMSSFRSTAAALRAARAIQRGMTDDGDAGLLQVRVGLHAGDVVEAGDDFFGTVVNKAARIAGVARPGEIGVSDSVRTIMDSDPGFRFTDRTAVPLKGLEGDHVIHRLEWQT
jgi:adenylate cyclase